MIGDGKSMTEASAAAALVQYMDDNKLDVDAFDTSNVEAREGSAETRSPDDGESVPSSDGESPSETGSGDSTEGRVPADASTDDAEEQKQSAKADDAGATPEAIDGATLAGLLGVETDAIIVEDDGAIHIRTKVNGTEGRATVQELLKGHQLERDLAYRRENLAKESRERAEEHAAALKQLTEATMLAQAMHHTRKEQITQERDSIDWPRFERENPAEAALARQKFVEALAAEDARLQDVASRVQRFRSETFDAAKARNGEALKAAMPEFFDPNEGPKLQRDMGNYLTTAGFSKAEIDEIIDHRVFGVVRDAMRFREMQERVKDAKTKVATLPKVVKPGTTTSDADLRGEKRERAMKRLERTGSEEDFARGLLDTNLIDAIL